MKGDETIRAFFAVDLDAPARKAASAVVRTLRAAPGGDRVRWVRPESLHVTLRFLGDIESSQVDPLVDVVDDALAGHAPFEMSLGEARLFPNPRRPRVVVLGLEPEALLASLAESVERSVVAVGFAPEARRFRPHLTLGRMRGREFPSTDGAPVPQAACEVREAVLFRSELLASGARYTPLAHIPFGPDRSRRAQRAEETNHPNR